MQLCSFLEDIPMLGSMPRAQLLALARVVRVQRWAPNSVLYRQGGEGSDMFIIRTG